MTLEGKGIFIWKIKYCEKGDVEAIADKAVEADFTHVLVKVADGMGTYNIDPKTGEDRVGPLVQALREREILVWGWQYVYGYDPIGEADKAIQRVSEHNLDGLAIDAEAEYKDPGRDKAAKQYMTRLRSGLPTLPVALSSYRYPSYHPQIPWDEFLAKCDIAMPQVYWAMSHNPGRQLTSCVNEYQSLNYVRPVIPTGSAYRQGDWVPTPADETKFMDKARELDLSAVNFWEWGHTRKYLPELWGTIRDYKWAQVNHGNIGQQYIAALNTHDPDQVIALYTDNAVHVSARHTIQGKEAIREWYVELFKKILPNGVYSLTNTLGTGKIRHVTWIASSSAGNVDFGSDTMGYSGDKISYHYTFFIVT
jgi:hypothetical protein